MNRHLLFGFLLALSFVVTLSFSTGLTGMAVHEPAEPESLLPETPENPVSPSIEEPFATETPTSHGTAGLPTPFPSETPSDAEPEQGFWASLWDSLAGLGGGGGSSGRTPSPSALAALQSCFPDIEFETSSRGDLIDVTASKGLNRALLRGLPEESAISTLSFLPREQGMATDIISAEAAVEGAVVRLAKHGPVKNVVRCDARQADGGCDWQDAGIPFTDSGEYIEFEVEHFSEYGGNASFGYDYLDNGSVLVIWNEHFPYFFNVSSGVQFSNYYEEYWTHNVFCGQRWSGSEWLRFCNDAVPFTWTMTSDNTTYINWTGHYDVTWSGKNVRISLTYYLEPDDENLTLIVNVENIGSKAIGDTLAMLWRVQDIRINNDTLDDRLFLGISNATGQEFLLNETLSMSYASLNQSLYELRDHGYMRFNWNNSATYNLSVRSEDGQYNAPIELRIVLGTLPVGASSATTMYWKDPTYTLTAVSLTDDEADNVISPMDDLVLTGRISDDNSKADADLYIDDGTTRIDGDCLDANDKFYTTACTVDGTRCTSCSVATGIASCYGNTVTNVDETWTIQPCSGAAGASYTFRMQAENLAGSVVTSAFPASSSAITVNGFPTATAGLAANVTQVTIPGSINFTATGTDPESNQYRLTVCRTDSITNGYPGTCAANQELCNSTATNSASQASCSYTTTASDEGTLTAYGFLCDQGSGACNSTSTSDSVTVEPVYGWLNVSIQAPTDRTSVAQNGTFWLNATVTCEGPAGAKCGDVYAYARYNGSSTAADTIIPLESSTSFTILDDDPFMYLEIQNSSRQNVYKAFGDGDLFYITATSNDNWNVYAINLTTGGTIWHKQETMGVTSEYIMNIAAGSDGHLVVIGVVEDYVTNQDGSMFTIKYNKSDGTHIWTDNKNFGTSLYVDTTFDDNAEGVFVDSNNDVYVVGTAGDREYMHTYKLLSANGADDWFDSMDVSLGSWGKAIIGDNLGTVLSVGYCNGCGLNTTTPYLALYNSSDGTRIWNGTYEYNNWSSNTLPRVALDRDGHYVLAFTWKDIYGTNDTNTIMRFNQSDQSTIWIRETNFTHSHIPMTDVEVLEDGRIVLFGGGGIMVYTEDGELDYLNLSFNDGYDVPSAVRGNNLSLDNETGLRFFSFDKRNPKNGSADSSWSVSWELKASGATDTQHYVDVFFNSSYGSSNVPDNDTEDRFVCIGECLGITITGASINATSPVSLNSVVNVSATIVNNTAPLDTITLQIDGPQSAAYNTTMSQSGTMWHNGSITLDEAGQWVFTIFANQTDGASTSAVANDQASNAYIETIQYVCGDTITTDFNLTADYTCTGTAFYIGAGSIMIDGTGFTISGDDTGVAFNNSDGYDGVTIRNTTVSGFENAVVLAGADNTLLLNNTFITVDDSVIITTSDDVNITENNINTITNTDADGVVIFSGDDLVVDRNNFYFDTSSSNPIRLDGVSVRRPLIRSNLIDYDTSIGYPVYINGSQNVTIWNNTFHSGVDSIYINGGPVNTNITNNSINVYFMTAKGINILDANDTHIERNNLEGNDGIVLASDAKRTTIKSNNFIVYSNYAGIKVLGARNTTIWNNTIDSEKWGVMVDNGAVNTNITNNTISTHTASEAEAIILYDVNDTTIKRNILETTTGGSNGVYSGSGPNLRMRIESNTITTTASSAEGVHLLDIVNATIWNNTIATTTGHGIRLELLSTFSGNNISENTFSVAAGYQELNISSAGLNGTILYNQPIRSYSFKGNNKFTVINSSHGRIDFIEGFDATSGEDFSTEIDIGQYWAYVNGTKAALNKSANITLYNNPYSLALIQRDGVNCSSTVCTPITSLTASTVIFSVSGWSNYSLANNGTGESDSPSITPNKPGNGGASPLVDVTFNFTVSDASTISNCSLYIDGAWNATNTSVEKAQTQLFPVTGLSVGDHTWVVNCTDQYDNNGTSGEQSFTVLQASTYYGNMTDLCQLNASNVSGFYVRSAYGNVTWNDPLDLTGGLDLDSHLVIGDGFVFLNSTALQALNASANLTLIGLSQGESPVIYKDGSICTTGCTVLSYNAGTLKFNVSGFSNYTAGNNAALNITDDTDSTTKYTGQQIRFYANYTNITSGDPINASGDECNISFNISGGWTAWTAMAYNVSSKFHEYNRTFTTAGTYDWNVTCSDTGYETLNLTDTVTVEATVKHWNGTYDTTGQQPGGWNVSFDAVAAYFYPVEHLDNRSFTLSGASISLSAESAFTGSSSIEEGGTTTFSANCSCSGGACDDVYVRIQDNRTGSWSDSTTGTGADVYVNTTSYNIGSLTDGQDSSNYLFNVTANTAGSYTFRAVCNSSTASTGTSTADLLTVNQLAGPPTISNLTYQSSATPQIGQNVSVSINFTASDQEGASELNDSSASASLSKDGVTRTGSCDASAWNATSRVYNCTVQLTYYDLGGDWTVNVSIADNDENAVYNDTETMSYGDLLTIEIVTANYNFGTLALGNTEAGDDNPLIVDNEGNVAVTELNLTAYHLANGSNMLGAGNFTVNVTDAVGAALSNAAPVRIADATISVDTDGSETNRSLYLYVTVPATLPSGTYSSQSNWVMSAG